MFKRSMVVILILVIAVTFIACNSASNDKDVIAWVNDEEIQLKEALFYLRLTEKQFEAYGKDIWKTPFDGRSAEEVAKERALQSVIKATVLSQKAEAMGIVLDDESANMAEEQANRLISTLTQDTISDIGLTEKDIIQFVKKSMVGVKALEELDMVIVDEEEINKKVEEQLEAFIDSHVIARVKVLYFKTVDEENNKLSTEQMASMKEKASEAYNEAIKGEDFKTLVTKYEQEDYINANFDGKDIIKGMKQQYDDTLFNLKENEVVLIETDEGYEVIKIEEYVYPKEDVMEQARKTFEQEIELNMKNDRYQKTYEEWKKSSEIKVDEEFWKIIKINKE